MNRNSSKQSPYWVLVILLGGLLAGIGLSWAVYAGPSPSKSPLSTSLSQTMIPHFTASPPGSDPQFIIEAGKPAPDFSLKNIDGKEIHLSDFAGKPVLINLWAAWCVPCQAEMPVIEKMYEKYHSSGLVVLGVNLTLEDNLPDIQAAIQKFHLSYPILLDESGHVSNLYEMHGIPTSFFIDSRGILRRIQIGPILPQYLDRYLAEILPTK